MPQRTFTLFHLSLVPVSQLDIETRRGDSREDWLRHSLSARFEFEHWGGGVLHWVPVASLGESILGLLERTRPHEHHEPPEQGGGEIITDEWQGAYVVIDPTHHNEGQRVSVENDVVGQPRALLKSLIGAINDRVDAPYQIEIEPLFDASRFWAFAARHDNVLRTVKFDFVVPNMWGTESDLEKDLRETGQQTGAERVTIGISSEHGVLTENQKIRDGVEYAEKGAGTVSAKSLDGQRFSSTARPRTTRIPLIQVGKDLMVQSFEKMKRSILGREQEPPLDDSDRPSDDPIVD